MLTLNGELEPWRSSATPPSRSEEMKSPDQSQKAVQTLRDLAAGHLSRITEQLDAFQPIECAALLVEAARVMDQHHIYEFAVSARDSETDYLRFDLAVRGWNALLRQLLMRMPTMIGIPLAPSTPDTRAQALDILHSFGAYAAMAKGLAMYEVDMLDIQADEGVLRLGIAAGVRSDHFLDALEVDRMRKAVRALEGPRPADALTAEQLDALIEPLVFPWETKHGTMIGYTAIPELDQYYLDVTRERAKEIWGSAGIHPQAKLPGCSGADLLFIIALEISFYLKHWRFVDVGKRKYPEANFSMSVTIWKTRHEMIENLSDAFGMARERVSAVLDLLTVKRSHADFFRAEDAPYIPLLIEVGDGHLLQPLSSVFRNPLEGVRRFLEKTSPPAADELRRHREDWMISDLNGLFQGDRFWRLERPVKLRRNGQTVTDIDAAIYDYETGDLALFQLKWQDWGSDPKSQRSKARNFVQLVDAWAQKTELWITQFGCKTLCEKLQLRLPRAHPPLKIHFFAVGRSNARFRSYGFATTHPGLVACTWHQLARMVLELTDHRMPLGDLHGMVRSDEERQVRLRPLPYEISIDGWRIVFEDVWRILDDEDDLAPPRGASRSRPDGAEPDLSGQDPTCPAP